MNQSYSPSMTCLKVQSGCLWLIFAICLWYHFLASLVRKLSRWRMHSLSQSFPPYCSASNITTRFDNQSSRSLNLGVPPYLLTESLSVLWTLLPLGMTIHVIRCCHISVSSRLCITLWWCSAASIIPEVLYCTALVGGIECPWVGHE